MANYATQWERKYERKKDLALLAKIALPIAIAAGIWLWLRDPEIPRDHIPPFLIDRWSNVSKSGERDLIVTERNFKGSPIRKVTTRKNGNIFRVYTNDWRAFEVIIKGDDLINVSEVFTTETRDGAQREGYEEIGFFARHSARN